MKLLKSIGGNEFFTGLISAEQLISSLATEALRLGLLIRGGATVGPLHHQEGVVLGKAMVEAYELESRVAIYPRVVVSPDLYSTVGANFDLMLLKDFDGVTHFNYFRRFIPLSTHEGKTIISWTPQARDEVERNITRLEASKRLKEAAKWIWFRNTVEQERTAMEKRFSLTQN